MDRISSAPVRHYATIDSTNLEAQRLGAAGLHTPTWLVADQQTAGIGRENRHWVSEVGNLYTTLLFPVTANSAQFSQLSIVAAVALYEALAQFIEPNLLRIKWPNDILIEGRKVSGILVQGFHSNPQLFAIGMGVNVAYAPSHMPYAVTCLNDYSETTPQAVFAVLRKSLALCILQWNDGSGFADIRQSWLAHAKCWGQAVQVTNGQSVQHGKFADMAADGALEIALPDGSTFVAYVGDVKFLESENT